MFDHSGRGDAGCEGDGRRDRFQECGSARAVADAVLYEGYLLYPYRRSSGKNRVRWQFGVLAPRNRIEARPAARASAAGSADTWRQRTECLVEARAGASLRVTVRFLQVQHRSVQLRAVPLEPPARPAAGPNLNEQVDHFVAVDSAKVGDERHLTFEEAVPQEFDVTVALRELLGTRKSAGREHVELIVVPGAEEIEPLGSQARVVRTRWPVSVRVRVSAEDVAAPFPLTRVRVDVENAVTGEAVACPRAEVLLRCPVATHCLLSVRDGVFVSLLDPPAWVSSAAKDCANLHTFPVLAGQDGGRDVMLSSPIILYDHPGIAPESPGELFDACEIDEILTLRTLTLTDEEKLEARATDPRARAILDRADAIPNEVFARLHGAVRSLRPSGEPAVSPDGDAVIVDEVRVARGSRVRLRPRTRGTDAHDMFLEGRTARVEAVLHDVDGSRHVAVVLEDDPGADLYSSSGRYHYFGPDEVNPLGEGDT